MNLTIGKYHIEKPIGQGSFGRVYLATAAGQKVALKCIPKKEQTIKQIRNLKGQTQLLTKIKHTNIISVIECFETSKEVVIVMEYAGMDLSKLLEREKKLPEEKVRKVGRQILNAMVHLNERRILHRDLKPQNILLQGDNVKLCDFGFAKQMSASTQFLNSIKGTPLYIAPEIIQKKSYTSKVDVWSLGIILYELATGRTPFYATSIHLLTPKILYEMVKYPSSMSSVLRELIDSMLKKVPEKRFDWEQVRKHKFFEQEAVLQQKNEVVVKEEEPQGVVEARLSLQEEIEGLMNMEKQFVEGRLQVVDLVCNPEFCQRVTRVMGEFCIDRTKTPPNVLLKTIKLVSKIAMTKQASNNSEGNITRNQQLMTAIVTLCFQEENQQFLTAELQLIGFLLKQNFDHVSIDTDHDDQITTIISRRLSKPTSQPCLNMCLKVLGILTSQALLTLQNSESYFERCAQQKIVSVVAQLYSPEPEKALVLEALEKFIHPRLKRQFILTYHMKTVFLSMQREAATVLVKRGVIWKDSPLSASWVRDYDLQIYCGVLFECLKVSEEARAQFMKQTYWNDMIRKPMTRLFYLSYIYTILRCTGIYFINRENIDRELAADDSLMPLEKVFLIYFAMHTLLAHNSSPKLTQKFHCIITNIADLLAVDHAVKTACSLKLLGFLNEQGFFDSILIEVMHVLLREKKEEELKQSFQPLLTSSLLLPLSQVSLLKVLDLLQDCQGEDLDGAQVKKLHEYFVDMIKKGVFQDLLAYDAVTCSRLLTHLLSIEYQRINEDRDLFEFAELAQKHQILRFLLSEQIITEELLYTTLKIINRILLKLTSSLEYASQTGLKIIQKYIKNSNQDLKVQCLIFCSSLARVDSNYCRNVLKIGVVPICRACFHDGSELLKEKTLHLVGNLAKHNDMAFEQFEKHNIVNGIHHVISQHSKSRQIRKNTVYAIGNISYYGEKFARELKPIIKYFLECLRGEDEHLMLNTFSAVSNLLRHSSTHLQELLDSGVLTRIIEIYSTPPSADVAFYISNLLRKGVRFPEMLKAHPKDNLRTLLERNISRGLCKADHDMIRNLKKQLA